MGYAGSWFAVRGKSREAVLADSGLRSTGKCEEIAESPVTGVALPGGWYAVVCSRINDRFTSGSFLRRLSRDCEVVACYVEEHVMASAAWGWVNGAEAWSIVHQSSEDPDHLVCTGTM